MTTLPMDMRIVHWWYNVWDLTWYIFVKYVIALHLKFEMAIILVLYVEYVRISWRNSFGDKVVYVMT